MASNFRSKKAAAGFVRIKLLKRFGQRFFVRQNPFPKTVGASSHGLATLYVKIPDGVQWTEVQAFLSELGVTLHETPVVSFLARM